MNNDIDYIKIKKNQKIESNFVNKFKIIQTLLKTEKIESINFEDAQINKYKKTLNYLNQVSDLKLKNSFSSDYLLNGQQVVKSDKQNLHLWKITSVTCFLLLLAFFPIKFFVGNKTDQNYLIIEEFKRSFGIVSEQIVKEIPGPSQEIDEISNEKKVDHLESSPNNNFANTDQISKEKPIESSQLKKDLTPKSAESQGFLYRGKAQVINLDMTAKKLVELLAQLGASKAGEVELGWTKGNMRYFHFTIPEAKYNDVIKVFNSYGKFDLKKETHPRVMPKEISRFIVEVTENKSGL